MPSLADLRARSKGWDNYSDEEMLVSISNQTGLPVQQVARDFKYELPKSDLGKELSAGWSNYKGGMNAIGAAFFDSDTSQWAADANRAKAQIMQSSSNAPHSWGDVKFGDKDKGFLNYVGQLGASSAPYLGEAATYGIADWATGGALTPAIVERYAGQAALKAGIEEAAARRLGTSAAKVTGMTAVTTPSSTGDILNNQYEQSGTYDTGYALPAGIGYAALNSLGLEGALARRSLTRGLLEPSASRLKNAAVGFGRTGFEEAIGETGQEVFNQYGRHAVDSSYDPMGAQAMAAYKESAIGGLVLGGLPGGVHGVFQKRQSLADNQPTELLDVADPQYKASLDKANTYVRPDYLSGNVNAGAGVGTQDWVNQQLGIGAAPAVAQKDITSAFNEKLETPVTILDANGKPYTTDSAADFYEFQQFGRSNKNATKNTVNNATQSATQTVDQEVPIWDITHPETGELLPTAKELGIKSQKKQDAYTQVAQAFNEGVFDQTEFENQVSSIQSTNKIGQVATRIAKDIQAARDAKAQSLQVTDTNTLANNNDVGGTEIAALAKAFTDLVTEDQARWWAAKQDPINDGKSDAELAKAMGFSRQNASKLAKTSLKTIVRKVAKQVNQTPANVEQQVRTWLQQSAPKATAAQNNVGMNPAMQQSVLDKADLTSNDESGSVQGMGVINTVGGSQRGNMSVGKTELPPNYVESVKPSNNAKAQAMNDRAETAREVFMHPEAKNAALDWDESKYLWDEISPRARFEFIADYIEAVQTANEFDWPSQEFNNQITLAQQEVENKLDRGDYGTEENGNRLDAAEVASIDSRGSSTDAGKTSALLSTGQASENAGQNRSGNGTNADAELARLITSQNEDLASEEVTGDELTGDEQLSTRAGREYIGGKGYVRYPATQEQLDVIKPFMDVVNSYGWGKAFEKIATIQILKESNFPGDAGVTELDDAGNYVMFFNPNYLQGVDCLGRKMELEDGQQRILDHEITHIIDTTNRLYSGEHNTKFSAVIKDIEQKFARKDPVAYVFNYPLTYKGKPDFDYRAEMLAELMSAFKNERLARALQARAPLAYELAQEIDNDFRQGNAEGKSSVGRTAQQQLTSSREGQTGNGLAQASRTTRNNGSVSRISEAEAERAADAILGFIGQSKLGKPQLSSRVSDEQSTVRYKVDSKRKAVMTDLGASWKTLTPKLLTNFQLVDQFGDKLKSLVAYMNASDKMTVMQQKLVRGSHDILQAWNDIRTKSSGVAERLDQVMHDATMWKIHPDLEFDAEPNAHLTDNDKVRYDELKRRYNALPENAKGIYQQVKGMLASNWDLRKNIYADVVRQAYAKQLELAKANNDQKEIDRINARIDKEVKDHADKIKQIRGPYFPLMRFGDYILVAESDELQAAREKLETSNGSDAKDLVAKIAAMEKDENHYQVHAFEKASEQQKMADDLGRAYNIRMTKGEDYQREMRPASFGQIQQLDDLLGAEFGGNKVEGVSKKIRDAITEMYLSSLPEHSALQRQIKRHGVQGASTDMMRTFAEAVERDSFYLSRMRYMPDMTSAMYGMKNESSASNELRDVYNNVKARMGMDFTYTRSPVASAITKLSSFYHLGVSPSYLMVNATQPWAITVPQLSGKFGVGRATGAMRNAWVDAGKIIKGGRDGEFFSLKNADLAKTLRGDELRMAEELQDLGKLDIAQNIDTEIYASGTDPKFIKAQRVFSWASHNIELVNRLSTALATYRLERSRGATHEQATDKAREMIELTQLTYDDTNAAYFMKAGHFGGWNRLPMQFRKYQQGMVYLLVRNAKEAFKGDKEARQSLAYLLTMQFMVAGSAGLPIAAPAALLGWIATSLFGDDDDEDGTLTTQIRNHLTDTLGEEGATAFWKGLPTLIGLDISRNIGMGDMFNPLPMMRWSDVTDAKTGRDAMSSVLYNAAGAPIATMGDFFDAAQMFSHGDIGKGTEKILPKFLASPLKAARYATEGMTTRKGNQVMDSDQFSPWDLAYKALGFSPVTETQHYEAQTAKSEVTQAIQDRRNKIIADYARARMSGEGTSDVMEDVRQFNTDHPHNQVRITQSVLIQAINRRKKDRKASDSAGVTFRKNEKYLRNVDRFATEDEE